MRLVYKTLALLVVGFFFVSCDFLDKEIQGVATEENYYDTEYKMQTVLNAAYDVLQSDTYWDQEWRFGEGMADNVRNTDESLSSQMGQLVMFRFTTSNTWILQRWEVNYQGIHRANQVIANIDRVQLSSTQYSAYTDIRYILGQAKFLRAFYYFNLVKSFGGVPIRPEVETVDNLVIPRSTKEECYAYIEKDLREAAIMLPTGYVNTSDLGKVTQGACVALLIKVLMYQATPGEASERWEEMRRIGDYMVDGTPMTYAEMLQWSGSDEEWEDLRCRLWYKPKALMTESETYESPSTPMNSLSSTYSLEYKDIYGSALDNGSKWAYVYQWYKDGEFCKGSIFEVVFKESADGTSGDTNEGSGFDFYNNVVMYGTSAIIADIFGNDGRIIFTIGHQEYAPDGNIWMGGEGRFTSLKWYNLQKDMPLYAGDIGKNARILRWVDVKLMYAEALNECGDREGALTQLNECKAQANTVNGSTNLYKEGGYGFIRDQIYEERRIEFCYEFDRYFDLIRQGRAAEVMHNYGNTIGQANRRGAYFTVGKHELLPIPQTEIDVSNGVVEQNPGY